MDSNNLQKVIHLWYIYKNYRDIYHRILRMMKMIPQKVESTELANYILAVVGPMNHLKLQKLIYYLEAYHLAYFDQSLINDEFEAWLHGPVSRQIWDYYKQIANIYDVISVAGNIETVKKSFEQRITDDQKDFINDVLNEYGGESAYNLECMTHKELPWIEARKGYAFDDKCEVIIKKETMQNYYKQNLYQ